MGITTTRRLALAGTVLAIVLAACSGSDDTASTATTASDGTTTTTAPAPTTTSAPAYRILSEDQLNGALLTLDALPAGYSQDPPVDEGASKTFCDYKQPVTEKIRVRRDFTKGGGISAELLSTGLRQYATPEQARAAFDAMTHALESCTEETYEGTKLTYSAMSAPDVGDASVGVKINADGTDLLQFFALVGPMLVNTGGGGLTNASADDVIALLKAQVSAYQDAASQ